MTLERWIRGSDETVAFDWRRPARELDVPLDLARALYLQAMQRTIDAQRIESLYLAWLRAAAAARQPAAPPPVPGRRTQVSDPRDRRRQPDADELRRLGPGKWTRSLLEERRDEAEAEAAATTASSLPGFDDVQHAIGAL